MAAQACSPTGVELDADAASSPIDRSNWPAWLTSAEAGISGCRCRQPSKEVICKAGRSRQIFNESHQAT